MNTAEADDEADDPGALAAVGCLRAISTILESVSRLPHLFVQVEPTLLPIMRRMLTTDGQGVQASNLLAHCFSTLWLSDHVQLTECLHLCITRPFCLSYLLYKADNTSSEISLLHYIPVPSIWFGT